MSTARKPQFRKHPGTTYLAVACMFALPLASQLPVYGIDSALDPEGGSTSNAETIDPFWVDLDELLDAEMAARVESRQCTTLADGMEKGPVSRNWNLKKMNPRARFRIQTQKYREGAHSLSISLFQDDRPHNHNKQNEKKIHKHELRIANHHRCKFGHEVWYSFSFHIDGQYPKTGSTRWVVGQWKEENDASPFLAQRFDNGVFHITIQINDARVLIATAPGDRDNFFPLSSGSNPNVSSDKGDAEAKQTKPLVELGDSHIDLESLRNAIANQHISRFTFVADPWSFKRIKGLRIEPSIKPLLPDPSAGWVDMRYRIKGGRDGNGIIEVWANGEHITRVTGKIGNDVFEGPGQYFKIGHYRDVDNEFDHSVLYFDRFKRSKKREAVD